MAVEEPSCKFLRLGERALSCVVASRSQMGTNSSDAHDHVLERVRGKFHRVDPISELRGLTIPP